MPSSFHFGTPSFLRFFSFSVRSFHSIYPSIHLVRPFNPSSQPAIHPSSHPSIHPPLIHSFIHPFTHHTSIHHPSTHPPTIHPFIHPFCSFPHLNPMSVVLLNVIRRS